MCRQTTHRNVLDHPATMDRVLLFLHKETLMNTDCCMMLKKGRNGLWNHAGVRFGCGYTRHCLGIPAYARKIYLSLECKRNKKGLRRFRVPKTGPGMHIGRECVCFTTNLRKWRVSFSGSSQVMKAMFKFLGAKA